MTEIEGLLLEIHYSFCIANLRLDRVYFIVNERALLSRLVRTLAISLRQSFKRMSNFWSPKIKTTLNKF